MEDEILVNPLDQLGLEEEKQTPKPTLDDKEDKPENSEADDKWLKDDKEKVQLEKVVETKKDPAKEKRKQEIEAWSAAEALRLRGLLIEREVKDASADITSLLELAPKDPKLAREVASRFDWTTTSRGSYDTFLTSRWALSEKPTEWSEEAKEEWYRERRTKEAHTDALTEAQVRLDALPEAIRDDAISEFNDLIEGKTLTMAKALKIVDLVTLSLQKEDKKEEKVDTTTQLKKLSSTSISTSKKPADDEPLPVIIDGQIVLLDPKKLS